MNDDAMVISDPGRTTKSSERLLSMVAIAVLMSTAAMLASYPA